MSASFRELEEKLGYKWNDFNLLEQAMWHTTWANEQKPKADPNERLEFLGDAVLDIVTAEYLMVALPKAREGILSQKRASLVKTCALAQRARELKIGTLLQVGKGAEYLRDVESVLADALEAVIGAAYLDGGIAAARTVVFGAGILK